MIERGGMMWPGADPGNGGIKGLSPDFWIAAQTTTAMRYVHLLPSHRRHTAICAGGHIGIMPKLFAQHFEHTLTFEPDQRNWECLLANMNGLGLGTKLKCIQAALWSSNGTAAIHHVEENSGASYIVRRDEDKANRVVDCMMLDYVGLQACDLLQLDVEGAEMHALEGAADTIYKHQPVIVIEVNQCAARYDTSYGRLREWLKARDYNEVKHLRIHNDHVFFHKDHRL